MKRGSFPLFVTAFIIACMVCLAPFTSQRAFAQINCTDITDYAPATRDQVPIPWVFWMQDEADPAIYMPWVRLSPSSEESLYIRWYYAFCPFDSLTIPSLGELVWDFDTDQPAPIAGTNDWECGNPDTECLELLSPGGEGVRLAVPISFMGNYRAIIIALEVLNAGFEVIGHSINAAIISSEGTSIKEAAINLDMRNTTGHAVSGIELDFSGVELSCDYDMIDAQGFIVGEEGSWGYDVLTEPLVINSPYGSEQAKLIWVDQERPLEVDEWVHLGLHFNLENIVFFFDFIVNESTTEVTSVMTSVEEICDGIDNDNDGLIDEGFDQDGDGVTTCAGDCDDTDPDIYPGAPELRDGTDNNCDGEVDEGCPPAVCEPLTRGFWKRICDGTFGEKNSSRSPLRLRGRRHRGCGVVRLCPGKGQGHQRYLRKGGCPVCGPAFQHQIRVPHRFLRGRPGCDPKDTR
ncbi:MAG: putative metal-binding motif-containing protein [bacterium]